MNKVLIALFTILGLSSASAQTMLAGNSGTSPPANSTGLEGQYFFNTNNGNIYGPKTTGTWPASPTTPSYTAGGTLTGAAPQLTLGANATTLGAIKFFGNTSGDVTVQAAAVAGTATVFQLPASNGTNGYFLQTNGSGVTSWAAASISPGGSDTQVQFNDSSAFGGDSGLTFNKTTNALTVSGNVTVGGNLLQANNTGTGTSATVIGADNIANTASYAFLGGQYSQVKSNFAFAFGNGAGQSGASSHTYSFAFGEGSTIAADYTFATGGRSLADRYGQASRASGMFAAVGDAQRSAFTLRCKTTTNAAVEMALDGNTTYLTVTSGTVLSGIVNIVGTKSDGSAVASYVRQVTIKNVGGTTTLVASQTVGTDTAAGTSLSITANDGSDYLSIKPTGITSETWRWVAYADLSEVAYGN